MEKLLILYKLVRALGMLQGVKAFLGFNDSSGQLVTFQINGLKSPIYLRRNIVDYRLLYSIFCYREYDSKLIESKIGTARYIIDAGANIGLFALQMVRKHPNSKIYCIEPNEGNCELLRINTSYYSNIVIYQSALWNRNTGYKVIDTGLGDWAFTIEEAKFSNPDQLTLTVEDVLTMNNIDVLDILKIDIEGSEMELFDSQYESWLPRVRCLIIELHDSIKHGSSTSFFSAISRYDFSFSKRGENLIFINNKLF